MQFNVKLFTELNEEYKSKPLVPKPPNYARAKNIASGNRRTISLAAKYALRGKRLIEIGCGRGETALALRKELGCDVVGVDVTEYPQWKERIGEGISLQVLDLSNGAPPELGTFDFAYSFAVWEHVKHPYSMLKSVHALLRPGAQFHFVANLYRGPKASHRYRQVFFPWPHLLFTDQVFKDYYTSIGLPAQRAAWVNQLSVADYYRYFELVGFEPRGVSYNMTPIDEAFYERFEDTLSRFPRFDLERDFIHTTLIKK